MVLLMFMVLLMRMILLLLLLMMIMMLMLMMMINKLVIFHYRDGYKPVVEVEEKHGGFTVYSER